MLDVDGDSCYITYMNDTPASVESHYSDEQKTQMLSIARQIITAILSNNQVGLPDPAQFDEYLQETRGCFVTMHHRHGQLRGCIGTFETDTPLIHTLVRMSASTLKDPRFAWNQPVVLAEINDIHLEISVLTPMAPFDNPTDLRLGVDGIYIKDPKSERSGCFLPHVPIEAGWDVEETLSQCCGQKMGIEPDGWKTRDDLEFYRFQADVFGEAAPGVLKKD